MISMKQTNNMAHRIVHWCNNKWHDTRASEYSGGMKQPVLITQTTSVRFNKRQTEGVHAWPCLTTGIFLENWNSVNKKLLGALLFPFPSPQFPFQFLLLEVELLKFNQGVWVSTASSNLEHLSSKIWHLVATILMIFRRINWPKLRTKMTYCFFVTSRRTNCEHGDGTQAVVHSHLVEDRLRLHVN